VERYEPRLVGGEQSVDERQKWEERYRQAQEPFYGRAPSSFLRRSVPLLPEPGRCLDAAGGEGRNAVFLASLGWQVVLVDLALAGLTRARERARAAAPLARGVWPVCADFARSPLRLARASLDLLLVVNYHDRALIAGSHELLRPGGVLLVEGFAQEQLGRSSGGPQDLDLLWGPNELLEAVADLRVLWYEDRLTAEDDNPRHRGEKWVVRLVARREG
jgi:SAM-dependent methyltransferase